VADTAVQLKAHDRLCLGGDLRDVYDSAAELRLIKPGGPWELRFWRKAPEAAFFHNSFLLKIPGVKCEHILPDPMHCLDLGVTGRLVGNAMVLVLKTGCLGHPTTEAGLRQGCQILTRLMKAYYKRKKIAGSRCNRITLKRLLYSDLSSKGH
jgi:hypothetical protein